MSGGPGSRAASIGTADALEPAAAPAPGVARGDDARTRRGHPRDYLLRRALAGADVLALALAAAVAAATAPAGRMPGVMSMVALLPAWLVLLRLYGLYERDIKRVGASPLDDVPALFHAYVMGTLGAWAALKLVEGEGPPLAAVLVFATAGSVATVALRSVARSATVSLLGPSRVLLIGDGGISQALVRKLRAHPEYGLEPAGRLVVAGPMAPADRLPCLGRLGEGDLEALLRTRRIDRVVAASSDLSEEEMMMVIERCGAAAVKVSIVPDHLSALGPSLAIDDVEGLTLLGLNPLVLSRSSRALKRSLDLVGAFVGLVVAAPLAALIVLAIRIDSPGPALFRQQRIGRGGRPFRLLKFRTMVVGAESKGSQLRALSSDPDWLKLERDPRVTRVGRILRAMSLDELPQLWNVLRGEMSLVGPRPLIASEDRLVAGWSRARLDLAPGITGLWQVLGRTDIPFREMVKLDYLYVTNWSLWLDIKLILRTIPAVVARRGAN